MALPSITTTFAGNGNLGLQVGYNSGAIHFGAPGKCRSRLHRPETPLEPVCFVPFRRDPHCIARGTLLDQICKRCAAPASRVALVGLGGMDRSTAPQSSAARAEQVKIRGRKDPHADVFKLVHDWLRNRKNGPLVLDNADNTGVLSPISSQSAKANRASVQRRISSYLPPSSHGSVLVTSRTRRAATQIVGDGDVIPIEPMDDAAAQNLLRDKLGDEVSSNESIAENNSI
ncbi:hypothetical protein BU24DRAFT_360624 [Aaosphaeria arxii CBS 175.79]|uniref:Fungal death-pathway protein SesB domain-containing protein n=1 Tax=Aaosphaeria arxii CBS 175.79 TaxID=1450172 RepID=A0A6A5X648_9PLEO|nr:uncharacterized protein BU24DRAFT_360624 [Aaosphaeria arxii CBS 175.79]KAF2008317.1 hypothetical protein BU24DRAFT_360624 [Aaosphaeria arxii CBS 175.79]